MNTLFKRMTERMAAEEAELARWHLTVKVETEVAGLRQIAEKSRGTMRNKYRATHRDRLKIGQKHYGSWSTYPAAEGSADRRNNDKFKYDPLYVVDSSTRTYVVVDTTPAVQWLALEGTIVPTKKGEGVLIKAPFDTTINSEWGFWIFGQNELDELADGLDGCIGGNPWPGSAKHTDRAGRWIVVDRKAGENFLSGRKPVAPPAPVVDEDVGQFILWCPTRASPPVAVMTSLKQAHVVAEKMASQNPGSKFYVCRMVREYEVPPAPAVTWKKL